LNISCPNVSPFLPYDATLKESVPSGASIGTVIFIIGGGGTSFYDTHFTYGASLINNVVQAGFTAVQLEFDNHLAGWLSGPALDGNGPLSLACLPATAIQWTHDNLLTTGTPLCATGNSGGSAAIAYALSQYGLGSILSLVEETSGPEFSRLDHGCAPRTQHIMACATCGGKPMLTESYGLSNAANFLDPAWDGDRDTTPDSGDLCSQGIMGSTSSAALFHHDSILSDTSPATLSFPTDVRIVFGALDTLDSAIPEGLEWATAITSKTTIVCLPGVGHDLASYQDGANQILSDVQAYCKLQ